MSILSRLLPAALLLAALTMSGCGIRDELSHDQLGDFQFSDRDIPDETVAVANRFSAAPISVFPTTARYFQLREQEPSDPLPTFPVGPLVADDVPIAALLDIIASENGIALSLPPEIEDRKVRLRDPSVRPFGDLLNIVAENAGVFFTYRGGVLKVDVKKDFDITVPPIAENLDTVSQTLTSFGAEDVQSDDRASILSFSADRPAVRRINSYLRASREASDLIIYDSWFLEVTLNKGNEYGINWNEFSYTKNRDADDIAGAVGTGGGVNAAPSTLPDASLFNLGLVATPGDFLIDLVAGFLDSVGTVRSLSKPSLTVISGGTTEFEVGSTVEYVSEVSNTVTDGGTSSSGASTSTLELGFKMSLAGAYADGVVYTELELEIENLLRFDEYDSGDTTLRLPQTAKRSLKTQVTSRPGDLLLMAGLLSDSTQRREDYLPLIGVPQNWSDVNSKTETIIMLRPRIVHFQPISEDGTQAGRLPTEHIGTGPMGGMPLMVQEPTVGAAEAAKIDAAKSGQLKARPAGAGMPHVQQSYDAGDDDNSSVKTEKGAQARATTPSERAATANESVHAPAAQTSGAPAAGAPIEPPATVPAVAPPANTGLPAGPNNAVIAPASPNGNGTAVPNPVAVPPQPATPPAIYNPPAPAPLRAQPIAPMPTAPAPTPVPAPVQHPAPVPVPSPAPAPAAVPPAIDDSGAVAPPTRFTPPTAPTPPSTQPAAPGTAAPLTVAPTAAPEPVPAPTVVPPSEPPAAVPQQNGSVMPVMPRASLGSGIVAPVPYIRRQ